MNIEELNGLEIMTKNQFETGQTGDKAINEENIFLKFVEILGYTDELCISPGAYDIYSTKTFQYALREVDDDDVPAKIFVQVFDYGADISVYEENIRNTIAAQVCMGNEASYYITTNCYTYRVYKNIPNENSICNLSLVGSFSLMDLNKDALKIIKELSLNGMNDDFDKEEDLDENNENLEDLESEEEPEVPDEEGDEEENTLVIDKQLIIKIICIIAAIIGIIFVFSFLFGGKKNKVSNNELEQGAVSTENVETTNSNTTNNIDLSSDASGVDYLTISAILDLTVSAKEVLAINLVSNLEPESVVKVGIFCGSNSSYVYLKAAKDGTASTEFEIPETWGDEEVKVGAYLKFDEPSFSQPKEVLEKYGENGEFISWNKDYSSNMICYSTINHSNALVIENKKNASSKKNAELLKTISKDFSSISTRVDAFGNIKHVPVGYSFDETNIGEKVHIYPMIFYDKASDTSYLYIICGYAGTQFVRFEKVVFTADGFNWSYENGTNEKKNKIVGNKKAEWIYFNNIDSSALLNDMSLLSSSKDTTIILAGSSNNTYPISDEEKALIKQFLYIYSTYYGNGTFVPDTAWFSLNSSTVELNSIKKPIELRERGSAELSSLYELQTEIDTKKLNGQTTTSEETDLLDTMIKTYRAGSETVINKVYDSLSSAVGSTVSYSVTKDMLKENNYMRFYFFYNNKGTIEDGYIPYLDILDNKTVIVPISTITSSTKEDDMTFATYEMGETLYNDLSTYFNKKTYQQF